MTQQSDIKNGPKNSVGFSKGVLFFSILVGTYPLLSVYRCPFIRIDLGITFLLLFFLFTLKFKFEFSELGFLISYVIVLMLLVLADGEFEIDRNLFLLRNFKFLISMSIVFMLGYRSQYFDEEIAFSTIKTIVFTNTLFIIFQQILYQRGYIFINPLSNFSVSDDYYTENSFFVDSGSFFRPSGFFLEPSHFSEYAIVFLIHSLFKTRKKFDSVLVSLGILCSGSGMGLVMTTALFLTYFLYFSNFRLSYFLKSIIKLGFFLICCYFILKIDFLQNAISRFTTENAGGGGNAIAARIATSEFSLKLSDELFLGNGLGNVRIGVYFNGLTYILKTVGLLGLSFLLYSIARISTGAQIWKRIYMIIFLGMICVAQVFNASFLIFFFCIYKTPKTSQEINPPSDSEVPSIDRSPGA